MKHQSVQVNELSEMFDVSLATVRRDLKQIEEQGSIRRVHGGAVYIGDQTEPPALQRKSTYPAIKKRIGEAAAALVRDSETIIITSGTTTEAMVPYLATKTNLTVITNAINVAAELTRHPEINVIVLGGWLRHSEFSLLGHLTEQALQDLRPDKIFHGTFGINVEDGLTGSYMQEAQTDRAMIKAAGELIVLADHSKFAQVGSVRLASIEAVTTVVTDCQTPRADRAALEERGINVICVEAAE